ncbi:hypothetical protein ACPPVQ_13670 [Diaminobutyricibacter sp. McL0618]|uniref:hypothetical protein n=1 Tax=Leifsonia sp. McL0618 TaxID=3415677 RepID=UPI003CEA3D1D
MQRRRLEEIERDRENARRIKELTAQLADLSDVVSRDYANAPIGDLQSWLRSQLVEDAQQATRSAFRARSAAMAVLWNLDGLHHESPNGKTCVCGRKVSDCRELRFLADCTSTLYGWEQQQLDRLKKGLECGLPREHPEMVKRNGYTTYRRVG